MPAPSWWDFSLLREYGHRAVDTGNPSDIVEAILLTYGEAAVFDERCRELPGVVVDTKELREFTRRLRACDWVVIESWQIDGG